MKILLVTPYYPPGLGGACRLLESAVLGLISANHSVDVLTFGPPMYRDCVDFDAAQPYAIHRVPAVEHRSREIVNMGRRLLEMMNKNRYDAILCGTAWSSGVLAFISQLIYKTPFVIYSHGEDTTIVRGSSYKVKLLLAAFRNARKIFANSKFTRNAINEMARKRVCEDVLYPTIDAALYAQVTDEQVNAIKRRLNSENVPIILTVARLQARKGHDTVIRCLPALMSEVGPIRYVIVGKGDISRLEGIAADLKVADYVTFLEDLNDTELAALYAASSLYVMVSRWDPEAQEVEGFGMTYLEAAAAGKPSVAGHQGGAAEAVINDVTGLIVEAESVSQTADAIAAILQNPQMRDAMGAAARRRVLLDFSTAGFVKAIELALMHE